MELLIAVALGVLTTCGVFLILRARTFSVVLGLTLLSHAVNLFLFSMGRLTTGAPAIVGLTGSIKKSRKKWGGGRDEGSKIVERSTEEMNKAMFGELEMKAERSEE